MRGFLFSLVIGLDQSDSGLLDPWKARRNVAHGDRVVHGAIRLIESVRGPVVAIDALHFEDRQRPRRFGLRAGSQVGSCLASIGVPVSHPGGLLPPLFWGPGTHY